MSVHCHTAVDFSNRNSAWCKSLVSLSDSAAKSIRDKGHSKFFCPAPARCLASFPSFPRKYSGGGECRRRWREHKRKQQKFSSQNARSFQTHLPMLFPDLWRTSCAARSSPRQLSHRYTHPNPPGTEWHGQLVYLQVAARNCGLTCSGDIGHQRSPGRSNTSLAFRPGPLRASRRARTGCRSVL